MPPPEKEFLVVSGLPGSGKSWLAAQVAPLLGLTMIDKDDILEGLFKSRGIGDGAWRKDLSREADRLFRRQSEASPGAVLVSFWHLPGMPADSGTPTGWLPGLSRRIVNLHCQCPVTVAAARFLQRKRHPGHLDDLRPAELLLSGFQDLTRFPPLEIGERVCVDTSAEIPLALLVSRISTAFGRSP